MTDVHLGRSAFAFAFCSAKDTTAASDMIPSPRPRDGSSSRAVGYGRYDTLQLWFRIWFSRHALIGR